jgi:hypothetical protein
VKKYLIKFAIMFAIGFVFATVSRMAHSQTNCSGVSSAGCAPRCEYVQVCDRFGCHQVLICR